MFTKSKKYDVNKNKRTNTHCYYCNLSIILNRKIPGICFASLFEKKKCQNYAHEVLRHHHQSLSLYSTSYQPKLSPISVWYLKTFSPNMISSICCSIKIKLCLGVERKEKSIRIKIILRIIWLLMIIITKYFDENIIDSLMNEQISSNHLIQSITKFDNKFSKQFKNMNFYPSWLSW